MAWPSLAGFLSRQFGERRSEAEERRSKYGFPIAALAGALLSLAVAPPAATNSSAQLGAALALLERSDSGQNLLELASRTWSLKSHSEILSRGIVRAGQASHTDAVLTRRFNPITGKESREREVTVYLRTDQTLDELTLDLAHELVHATTRPTWDPYDAALTPSRYMQTAIEGPGGEVDAVVMECQVARELIAVTGATETARARCKDYWTTPGAAPDRVAILKDFYRVGHWKASLERRLGSTELKHFPLLDDSSPRLYSSTGNAPYPVALLREFDEITQIACENSRRRRSAAAPRAPASVTAEASADRFIAERCR